ncbi:MAG: FAD-dependent oxidoreductase [Campylobacterales bacterium]|nr:FAD-dependent oxidoreductase [Campylobacterales bacterium]
MNGAKKKVIVVGGGYGGVRAAQGLAKDENLEVLLLDVRPYHYLQTDVYDFIANKTTITDISISLVTLFFDSRNRVLFLERKIVAVDTSKQVVISDSGEELYYDYLILAVGSKTFFPSFIEGLREHAHGVKTIQRAFEFKIKFEQAIYKKVESEGSCGLNPDFNIVVGGGGLSGVEIAAAMAEYSQRFFAHGGFACGGMNVYLIEGSNDILNGLDIYLVKKSRQRLEKLGVKVLSGVRITKVEEECVHLSNGENINMSFMIWTGGIEANTLECDAFADKNQRGQLKTDEFLRVLGYENVFAVGDCAEIKNNKGEILAPTAMLAEFSADIAVHNICASAKGLELKPVTFSLPGILVALGGYYTVGLIYGVKISGIMAYIIKRVVSDIYKMPLLAKCKKSLVKS